MSRPEGEENDDGQRSHFQGWITFMFTVGGASLCLGISIMIICYYVYVRRYSNRPRQAQPGRSRTLGSSRGSWLSWTGEDYFFTQGREGLRRQAVDALPVFVYNPENCKDGLRCAVCLCDFQEKEKGRLLPNCDHSFHVDCIDMWFSSHSTCPICRASVEKQSDEGLQSPISTTQVDVSFTEEENSSDAERRGQKENQNQHGTDDHCNV